MEYQKPRVEGILKENLKNLPGNIALICGSDCHDWREYPYHDKSNKNLEFYHLKAKIKPTFKGLLMAITSPETRFNLEENKNKYFIKEFTLGNNLTSIKLVNGINVIIGENGSGKTSLLKLLTKNDKEPYVKDIIDKNQISLDLGFDLSKIKYIGQGEIIKKFNEKKLFCEEDSDSNFEDIDHKLFKDTYNNFSNELKNLIKCNIDKNDKYNELKNCVLEYKEELISNTFYVQCQLDNDKLENIHEAPKNELEQLKSEIKKITRQNYFEKYKNKFEKIEKIIEEISNEIDEEFNNREKQINIKNIILNEINEYNRKFKLNSNT